MAYIVRVYETVGDMFDMDNPYPEALSFTFKDNSKDEVFAFVRTMADRHNKCVCIFHRKDTEEEMIHRASQEIFNDHQKMLAGDRKKGE